MDYEEMLNRAKEKLPEDAQTEERFTVPKVLGHIEGNKTVVNNFSQIADALNRPVEHLLKYILRELAAAGKLRKGAILFNTKLSASKINDKIQQYCDTFVICKECGKPDTRLIREGDFTFIKCTACGARYSITSKI